MAKVLMLIDSLGSGGAQRQFVQLAVGLKRLGHAVQVVYYHHDDFFKDKLLDAGIEPALIPPGGPLARIWRSRALVHKAHPDTVISFLDTPNLLATLARLSGAGRFRLLVSERNTDVGPLSLRRRLSVGLLPLADAVVANSQTQTDLLSRHPTLRRKLHWIPNCVDLQRFHPAQANQPPAADALLRVLIAGRFEAQKNVLMVARWAAGASLQRRVRLAWYGNQFLAERPTLESGNLYLAAKSVLGSSEMLTLHPPTQGVEALYRGADAFCLPSLYEGTPNVVCEAMASGLPIVCSRVCDNPFIVQEGVNGFLFDPASLSSFDTAMAQLEALSEAERAEMGRRNRARAEELFSEHAYLSRWAALL